jgi:hypothetical protein
LSKMRVHDPPPFVNAPRPDCEVREASHWKQPPGKACSIW